MSEHLPQLILDAMDGHDGLSALAGQASWVSSNTDEFATPPWAWWEDKIGRGCQARPG